jgi:hypothetical protein
VAVSLLSFLESSVPPGSGSGVSGSCLSDSGETGNVVVDPGVSGIGGRLFSSFSVLITTGSVGISGISISCNTGKVADVDHGFAESEVAGLTNITDRSSTISPSFSLPYRGRFQRSGPRRIFAEVAARFSRLQRSRLAYPVLHLRSSPLPHKNPYKEPHIEEGTWDEDSASELSGEHVRPSASAGQPRAIRRLSG